MSEHWPSYPKTNELPANFGWQPELVPRDLPPPDPADLALLGAILGQERLRCLMYQCVLSERSGITQAQISKYERGRVTPSWPTFVTLLAAMNRKPVLRTIKAFGDRPLPWLSFEARLAAALTDALAVIGERPYRIDGEIARHLHGFASAGDLATIDTVELVVHADPEDLEKLAVAASIDGKRTVQAVRGGGVYPHVMYEACELTVVRITGAQEPVGVEIVLEDRVWRVAPPDELMRIH